MAVALAIFSTACGVLATLFMLVMLMAGGANSTPAQITQIKWMLIGVAAVGLAGLVGGIWAMVGGRPGLAAAVGGAPVVVVITMVIVLVKLEW